MASPALWPARSRLAGLKATYKSGSYSGHPEDMLEAIEGVEFLIRRRIEGTRPSKQTVLKQTAPKRAVLKQSPVEPVLVVAPAPAERSYSRRQFEELTARSHADGGPFEPGLEAARRRLDHMQDLYRTGGYMGHPEDLLNDIDDEKRCVDRLTAAAE
ncbi:MAG TPA: hypothetical protein VF867_16095 [Arthrobacter sp.]